MPSAYVLINCELGFENKIVKGLEQIPEIVEISEVDGTYDMIVKVRANNLDKLREIIDLKIRRLELVKYTLTLIAMESVSLSNDASKDG
jgi:DNA-binding Lrp family transcriptional regulator